MTEILLIIIGLALGALTAWLLTKLKFSTKLQAEVDLRKEREMQLTMLQSNLEKDKLYLNQEINKLQIQLDEKNQELKGKEGALDVSKTLNIRQEKEIETMNEKLKTLKTEIEQIGQKYAAEFKNLANEILEDKSQKFTIQNQKNLESILKPLDENIREFKKTVSEAYDKESKERFSLGNEVKKLAELNLLMSEEARNLTKALKGEAKTQGDWGEMILETILEKSGLRRDEEYFMQMELKDEEGKAIRSDSGNSKMRPDAVIKYPDNRTVIIDSKVSLNAFTRYMDATDQEIQKKELDAHVSAVKNHIISLSNKGYDDYDKALDFVMMFIPSEPAYIAAMQGDGNLWSFAYEKRILLMNPTNLITSLKLIVDLWKREYQNRNAQAIADRGALLYDKFAGFVDNLKDVGDKIEKANKSYQNAYSQLATGPGNLLNQANELKKLGVKSKKQLGAALSDE
jgi:DNA recombination protein RmuC